MAELKKCPFCGGEAILDREDIFCDDCHLSMKIHDRLYNREAETYEEAKKQTIEAWNNRVTEADIRAKALDEVLAKVNTMNLWDSRDKDMFRLVVEQLKEE